MAEDYLAQAEAHLAEALKLLRAARTERELGFSEAPPATASQKVLLLTAIARSTGMKPATITKKELAEIAARVGYSMRGVSVLYKGPQATLVEMPDGRVSLTVRGWATVSWALHQRQLESQLEDMEAARAEEFSAQMRALQRELDPEAP
jgi:hypothetical protein